MLPRETAILDAYLPTIVPLCALGGALTWGLDRLLARTRLYQMVWHLSLFRVSLLFCVCGMLGLTVYH